MKQTKEIADYENRFGEEVIEIVAVTGPNGFGGGRGGKEKYWTASIGLTAWKRAGETEVCTGQFQLTAKADDEKLSQLRKAAQEDQVISVKVRRNESRFLLVSTPQAATDPELEGILSEQIKVVTYEDPDLGTFTRNRSLGWYENSLVWLGQSVCITFEDGDAEETEEQLQTVRELVKSQAHWDEVVRKFAAEQLLELKNDTWLNEDEEEVTEAEFMRRLKLESIAVSADGQFEFWFEDDDIFWGHSINVSGSLSEGMEDADIQG